MSRLILRALARAVLGCSLVVGALQVASAAGREVSGTTAPAASTLPDAAAVSVDGKEVPGAEVADPLSLPVILCGVVALVAIVLCFYLCARWTRTDKAIRPSH